MSEKIPLSVVVLAKNEAGRITECLRSVAWADELLVIDDDSSDNTAAIAQSMGATVLRRTMDIEGRHRNWAHSQAKHPWILSLDADERVTPELEQEIRRLFADGPQYEIYTIPRRNYIGTRWVQHGGWYPSSQVKLFKPAVFRWEETTVHPRAISDRPWGTLRSDIIHYSYRDLGDFIGKLNRQTTLEAQKWVQDGRRMTAGKALWRTGDRFYRTWVGKKGRRDGFLGYVVAVFAGFYQFLSFAKYWHWKHRGKERPPDINGTGSLKGRNRSRLSAVILAKNAAEKIRPCLESVRWMDEVIVVDGGSTDGTQEICRRAEARVIVDETSDDFGKLRNAGTAAASGDWILQLDADEVVMPDFRKWLESLAPEPKPYAAYKFRRRNNFLGHWMRHGGWDHLSLHLFHRGSARYEGRVHEKLLVEGAVGTLPVGVEHYPFGSLEEFMERQNRYTLLEARQMLESNPTPPMKEIWRQTTLKPAKLFWKLYIKKQGFREGMIGFIFCGLFAFVHFMKWIKVWEMTYAKSEPV